MEIPRHRVIDRFGALIEASATIWWFVVAGCAVLVYVFTYVILPGTVKAPVYMYLIQPLMWLILALLAFVGWRYALPEYPPLDKPLLVLALLIGSVQIGLSVVAGYMFGFGRSPYGHRMLSVLGNVWYVGTMLVGMELARAYLVVALGRRLPFLAVGLGCVIFSALSVPLARYGSLNQYQVFETVGGLFLPTLAENLLASFLALVGGPLVPIAHRGLLLAFEWLSPILPDLEWIVRAFLGTIVPALGTLIAYNQIQKTEGSRAQSGQSTTAWVFVALVAVVLLWFNTGLFGVQPSLIASGSMTPALKPGDIVVTQDVLAEEIAIGDIIRYRMHGIYVIHRVVDIQNEGDTTMFITRGDDNNANDPPVPSSELAGKVVLVIPKIGWIAVVLRRGVNLLR